MSQTITVIKGDGVGPDIVNSALQILDKAGCDFSYDFAEAGQCSLQSQGAFLPDETMALIAKNKVTLKGPLTFPDKQTQHEVNVLLNRRFEFYAKLRAVMSFKSTKARYDDIDIIAIRDCEMKSIEQLVTFAYELARQEGRKTVTAVHTNDMEKLNQSEFIDITKQVANLYPDIESNEIQISHCCMQLVLNPNQFDVLVGVGQEGEIISDLCSGLVGGLGMVPGASVGKDNVIFEAVHGSAPSLAGKNLANPTSVILASIQMLEYLNMGEKARQIRKALQETIESGENTTRDLGGQQGTSDFTEAVIKRL